MAEALSIAAAIIATVQVANAAIRVLDVLRNVNDSKYEEIYWTAVAQREISLSWVRRWQLSGSTTLPEQLPRVTEIVEKLENSYKTISTSLHKLCRPDDEKITPRMLAYRMRFETRGFASLKETLGAITAMNQALILIAPAPHSWTGDDVSLLSRNPVPVGLFGSPMPSKLGAMPFTAASMDKPVGDTAEPRKVDLGNKGPRTLKRTDTEDSISNEDKNMLRQTLKPYSVSSLHSLCCSTLTHMVDLPAVSSRLKSVLADLQKWAVCMLDEVAGLDVILHPSVERNRGLREFVMQNLVNIAIGEDILLQKFQEEVEVPLAMIFEQDRGLLLSALGKGQLLDLAMLRWVELADLDYDEENEIYEGEIEPSKDGDDVMTKNSRSLDTRTKWTVEDLELMVQSLQEILPAIRSARQAYKLDLETAWATKTAPANIVVGPLESASTETSDTPDGLSYQTHHNHSVPDTHSPQPSRTSTIDAAENTSYETVRRPQVAPMSFEQYEFYIERVIRLATDLEEALLKDEEFAKSHKISNEPIFSKQLRNEKVKLKLHQSQIKSMGPQAVITPEQTSAIAELNNVLRDACNRLVLSFETVNDSFRPTGDSAVTMDETIQKLLGTFNRTTSILNPRQIAVSA